MSKSTSKGKASSSTIADTVSKMVKDPKKIVSTPIQITKTYTSDDNKSKVVRSSIENYAKENPVKTAALVGVGVVSVAAVVGAVAVAAPLALVNPVAAIGLVGITAVGASVAFTAANKKLITSAYEAEKTRPVTISRKGRETLSKMAEMSQGQENNMNVQNDQKNINTSEVRENFQELRDKYISKPKVNINISTKEDSRIINNSQTKRKSVDLLKNKDDNKNLNSVDNKSNFQNLRDKYQIDNKAKKKGLTI